MTHQNAKDKWLMRSKDLILIVGAVLGMLAGIGKLYVMADAVTVNAQRIDKMEPVVMSHETKIALNDERWMQIQRQIESMNKKLDRENRDSFPRRRE